MLSLLGGFLTILSGMAAPLLVEAHLSLFALGGVRFLPPHAYGISAAGCRLFSYILVRLLNP